MQLAFLAFLALASASLCAAQVSPAALFLIDHPPDAASWTSRVSCGECTSVFGLLLNIGSNSTEQQQILKHANATCDLLLDLWGGSALYHLCERIGWDVIAKFLPFLWEELGSSKPGLAWDARAICSNFIPVCSNPCCATPTRPEKVRLAFADASNFTRVAATWSTLDDTHTHTVQWALGPHATDFPFSADGISRTYALASCLSPTTPPPSTRPQPALIGVRYTKGGWSGHVHTSIMQLQPGVTYSYRVGDSSAGWSDVFTCVKPRSRSEKL